MSLGRGRRGDQPVVRLDDNVETYDAARDGRSAEGRLQEVRLDRIEPSPFQVRLVFPADEIERLADSVLAIGLIHEPRARPHPTRPGWVELMPGEMRVRALQRLVERDQAGAVLRRDSEGNWLVAVRIEETDDVRADAMVFGENFDRTDLSAWEWAVAFQKRRDRLRGRGEPCGVRDVAASMGKRAFQTVGEYLLVADAIGLELLLGAGVVAGGQPDHARLARLSLAALLRVARSANGTASAGAQTLLQELRRAGDAGADAVLASRERALRPATPQAGTAGLQINIRHPLAELPPRQARHYLLRLAPAVAVLAARAAAEDGGAVESIAARLLQAVEVFRNEAAP